MSYDVNRAVRTVKTGSPRDKAVLFLLADMADDDGLAYPSVRTIAEFTELSKSSVERALRELRKKGFFFVEKRSRGEFRSFNRYHLNLKKIYELSESNRQSDSTPRHSDSTPRQCDANHASR